MVSLGITLGGILSTIAVVKQKINDGGTKDTQQDERLKELETFMNKNQPLLAHLSKSEDQIKDRLDNQGNSIVSMQQQITQVPTMTEVRNEFVSKEMFKQMEKHIDEKFDRVENGIEKILEKLK